MFSLILRRAARLVVLAWLASFTFHNSAAAQCTLPAPTGLRATPVCGGVQLNWNFVSFAAGYFVYRSTSSGSIGTVIASPTGPSYPDMGPTGTQTYYYRVQTRCTQGTGGITGPVGPVGRLLPPPAPSGLSTSSTCSEIHLTWSAVAGATSYRVYRGTGTSQPSSPLATVSATDYHDTSARTGTTYRYWVQSVNACNPIVPQGNSAGPVIGKLATPLPAPTNVQASRGTFCDRVRVTWNPVNGAIGYQVWRNGALLQGNASSPFDDFTASPGTTYSYTVVAVSPVSGCNSPPSAPSSGFRATAPQITQQPSSLLVCAGSPAQLQVVASGPVPLSYQWYQDGNRRQGATQATLLIASATPNDAGSYTVEVSTASGCSTTSAAARLDVDTPLQLSGPFPVTACPGQRVSFTVGVSGAAAPRFQWRFKGTAIQGATAATYTIASVTTLDQGNYDVTVTNACGSLTSPPASLTLRTPARVVVPPTSLAVCEGADATFRISATGTPPLTYQWSRDGTPVSGANGALLTLRGVQPSQAGTYACTVGNACGQVQSPGAVLTVTPTLNATWYRVGGGTDDRVTALALFDDGLGRALYAGGDFGTAGGVAANRIARWDGTAWSALGSGINGSVHALQSFDDGSGPALFAAGNFSSAGGVPAGNVAYWRGGVWQAAGSGFAASVDALVQGTSATGPRLYAAGQRRGPRFAVASWDGSAWTALGDPGSDVHALAVFDHGTGPELHAGTDQGVLRWDGQAWQPLGSGMVQTHALAVFDAGGGPELYAGGGFGGHVAVWRGGQWQVVASGTNGDVVALEVFDDGRGPRLIAAGRFGEAGLAPALGLASFDGTAWSPLGTGVSKNALALRGEPDGPGSRLYVGGELDHAGGVPVSDIALWLPRTMALALSQPAGSGSLQVENRCGPPAAVYFTAFSIDPNNAASPGTGNWFGLHLSDTTRQAELAFGAPPFLGLLDATGGSTTVLPAGSLSSMIGLDLGAVTVSYQLPSLRILAISDLPVLRVQ